MAVDGNYGSSGAIYRTEIDTMVRVTQSGGFNSSNTWFKAEYADGTAKYYGNDSNSRNVHGGITATHSWLVSYSHDATENNYIHYNYQDFGVGEKLLTEIFYTGNSANSEGNRKVEFNYEPKPIPSLSYIAGGQRQSTQQLSNIKTYYDSTELRAYNLNYRSSDATERSLLDSVQLCFAQNHCLSPTTFEWQDNPHQFVLEKLQMNGQEVHPNDKFIRHVAPRGDVDGNGVRDWTRFTVNAEGQGEQHNFNLANCVQSDAFYNTKCFDADINRDGLTDGFDDVNNQLVISLNNYPSSAHTQINTGIPYDRSTFTRDGRRSKPTQIKHVADFNGDTFPDLVIYRETQADTSPKLIVYYHTQNHTAPYNVQNSQLLYTYGLRRFRIGQDTKVQASEVEFGHDIDGNGLPDLQVYSLFYNSHLGLVQLPIPILNNIELTKQDANGNMFWETMSASTFSHIAEDDVFISPCKRLKPPSLDG